VPKNIGNEDQHNDLHFFEELDNIENRVAWFLAELCKAENGVQKDKRNQRRTELVRGVFSASHCDGKVPIGEVVANYCGQGRAFWMVL